MQQATQAPEAPSTTIGRIESGWDAFWWNGIQSHIRTGEVFAVDAEEFAAEFPGEEVSLGNAECLLRGLDYEKARDAAEAQSNKDYRAAAADPGGCV